VFNLALMTGVFEAFCGKRRFFFRNSRLTPPAQWEEVSDESPTNPNYN